MAIYREAVQVASMVATISQISSYQIEHETGNDATYLPKNKKDQYVKRN